MLAAYYRSILALTRVSEVATRTGRSVLPEWPPRPCAVVSSTAVSGAHRSLACHMHLAAKMQPKVLHGGGGGGGGITLTRGASPLEEADFKDLALNISIHPDGTVSDSETDSDSDSDSQTEAQIHTVAPSASDAGTSVSAWPPSCTCAEPTEVIPPRLPLRSPPQTPPPAPPLQLPAPPPPAQPALSICVSIAEGQTTPREQIKSSVPDAFESSVVSVAGMLGSRRHDRSHSRSPEEARALRHKRQASVNKLTDKDKRRVLCMRRRFFHLVRFVIGGWAGLEVQG